MLITEYRLELAIQALRAILPLAHPADTTLRYFFKDERIGSNERELVAETVFGVLRHRLLLEITCAGNATPRRMALAWLVRFGGYNLREIEPVLKHDEKEWLATVKGVKVDDQPLPVRAELPEWLVEKMHASYSDEDILAIGTLFIDDSEPVLDAAREYGIAHLLCISQPDSRRGHREQLRFPALADFDDILPVL